MDIITSPTVNAILGGALEILFKMYQDVNFHWYSALAQGMLVGACTMVGGTYAGQFGMIIGGMIGSAIGSHIGPTVKMLRRIIRQLDVAPLQNLYTLLWNGIKKLVNRNIYFADFLEMFGQESSVRLHILEIITNFLISIRDDRGNLEIEV